MGRPKTYDRETVARSAMQLFWRHGFQATSIQMLAESCGVNRYSLFAEFGNKQGLFEAAVKLYQHNVIRRFSRLYEADAGVDDVMALLDFFAGEASNPGAELGCLLCNVATERGPHDPSSRVFVEAYVDHIRAAFYTALSQSQAKGELPAGVSCGDQSQLLTSAVLGFWVLMRAGADPEILLGAARAGRAQLEGLLRLH